MPPVASDAGVALPGLPGGGLPTADGGLPLPGGNGDAGLPGLPALPGGTGLLGGGGLPTFDSGLPTPGTGGAGLPGGLGARVKCLEDLRACTQADITKATSCAETARTCLAAAQP